MEKDLHLIEAEERAAMREQYLSQEQRTNSEYKRLVSKLLFSSYLSPEGKEYVLRQMKEIEDRCLVGSDSEDWETSLEPVEIEIKQDEARQEPWSPLIELKRRIEARYRPQVRDGLYKVGEYLYLKMQLGLIWRVPISQLNIEKATGIPQQRISDHIKRLIDLEAIEHDSVWKLGEKTFRYTWTLKRQNPVL